MGREVRDQTVWPRSPSMPATRSQHHPPCQAPWISTKVLVARLLRGPVFRRYHREIVSLDLPQDQLVELNRRHLWNPFTQMKGYLESDPLVITGGEGVRLFDAGGSSYLDGNSSLWLNIHGHNRPELNAAITEQLGRIAHSTLLGMGNVPAIQLAERLAAITPEGLRRSSTPIVGRPRSRSG